VPVTELPLHGPNHGTVVLTRLGIRLLLDLNDEEIFVIMPTLMHDNVWEDPLPDSAPIVFGKVNCFGLKSMTVVLDIYLVCRKVRGRPKIRTLVSQRSFARERPLRGGNSHS